MSAALSPTMRGLQTLLETGSGVMGAQGGGHTCECRVHPALTHGGLRLLGVLLWAGVPRLPGMAESPGLGQRPVRTWEGPCRGASVEGVAWRKVPTQGRPGGSAVGAWRAGRSLSGVVFPGPLSETGPECWLASSPWWCPPSLLPVSRHPC